LKVSWVENPLALCKVGPSNMWEMVATWMLVVMHFTKCSLHPKCQLCERVGAIQNN
jgi:hypothetical protein